MRKDVNQIAAAVVAEATGKPEKNQFAVGLAKLRAKKLTPERRREIAAKAATTRWKVAKKK